MNLAAFLSQRERREAKAPRYRQWCFRCLQPNFSCYCLLIKKFDPQIKFVILTHPLEARRRIATGRMSHLILERSELILGYHYSNNSRVNELIACRQYHSVILYPSARSLNLTLTSEESRPALFPKDKELLIFVIDGTWNTAKKTVRLSSNLLDLPHISFVPTRPSNFRVRKQPSPLYYSTIEAIHHTIELLGPSRGFATENKQQDHLLFIFDHLVDQQVAYVGREQVRRPLKTGI